MKTLEVTMPVFVTVPDLARQMGKTVNTLYEWARREEDPLPLRYERGTSRSGCVAVAEFMDWWKRNSVHYQERREK